MLLDSATEEAEGMTFNHGETTDDLLELWKIFNNADEFKYALLRYFLKTIWYHDVQIIIRQVWFVVYWINGESVHGEFTTRLRKEEASWWWCYLSTNIFFKVRLYNSTEEWYYWTIVWRMLRVSPEINPKEMEVEIKREYNIIVRVYQFRKAKKNLANKRKASYEAQFARLWDYQEEIRKSNRGPTMEIETILGPTHGSL